MKSKKRTKTESSLMIRFFVQSGQYKNTRCLKKKVSEINEKKYFLISTGLLSSFYQLIIQGYTQQAQLRLRVQQQLKHRSVRH